MPNATKARALSHAFTLSRTLMTGAALFALSPLAAQADAGDGNFFFFGDSATGQGNWSAIVGGRGEDHSPYSSNNGFMRETNGLIWAEMLGRDVDIILDPDADSSNINFAISGAHMTRSGDLAAFGIETGVLTQTKLFSDLVEVGAISVGSDDVAFMLAGGNDYLDRLEMDDPADQIMADVAAAAATNVRFLADAGVKTIILSEIQPLQYAPQFADSPEVQAAMSDLVDDTNAAILAAVAAEQLPEDVNIVTMKYGAMVDHIVNNATELGFTNVSAPCLNEDDQLCSDDYDEQNKYLFLDDLHFTANAQAIQADWWMATLEGANGAASRKTGRMARSAFEQFESHRGFVRPGTHTTTQGSFAAWLSPLRSSLDLKERANEPGARLSLDGAVFGMEGRFAENFVIGGVLSAGENVVKFHDGSRYRMEGGALSVYGALDYQEDGRLSLSLTRGVHDVNDIRRETGVAFLSAQGETDIDFWDVELAARCTDALGPFTIDHGMSLSAGRIEVDSYLETGARGLALSYDDQALNYRRLDIDAIVHGPGISLASEIVVRPVLDVAYAFQFGDDDYAVTSRLIDNTAGAVTVRSNAPTEDRFDAGIGAELSFNDRWFLTARYARQWANDIEDADEGSLTLRAAF